MPTRFARPPSPAARLCRSPSTSASDPTPAHPDAGTVMSINAALGAALTGLRVNQKAIEIASHNVANAHTEGYSRQVMQRQTVAAGGVGGGVATAAIARTVDDFVIREIRTQSAALGADTVRSDYLSRTQDLFGSLANNTSF